MKTLILCLFCLPLFIWAETLPLKELLAKSYQESPQLQISEAEFKEKDFSKFHAGSFLLPKAYLNLKKQKDFFKVSSPLLKSLNLTPATYQWSLDYEWSIFQRATILNLQSKNQQAALEFYNYSHEKDAYRIQFQTLFLNHLLALYKSAALKNSLQKAETAKKEAALGMKIGQKNKIDVLRTEANYTSLSFRMQSSFTDIEETKSKFLELSGLKENDLDFLKNVNEDQILKAINDYSFSNEINEKYDLSSTINFQKNEFNFKLNELQLEELTESEWPTLKLQGSYSNGQETFSEIFHHPNRDHTLALVLTIPLFAGGSLPFSSFEKYHATRALMAKNQLTRESTNNQLKNTILKIKSLETQNDSLLLNLSQFEELYRLTYKSYQLGKNSLIELLEAQEGLLNSKIELATLKIELFTLKENYRFQTGNL